MNSRCCRSLEAAQLQANTRIKIKGKFRLWMGVGMKLIHGHLHVMSDFNSTIRMLETMHVKIDNGGFAVASNQLFWEFFLGGYKRSFFRG